MSWNKISSVKECEICFQTNNGTNYLYCDHWICDNCKKKLKLSRKSTIEKWIINSGYCLDDFKIFISDEKLKWVKRDIKLKHMLKLAEEITSKSKKSTNQ